MMGFFKDLIDEIFFVWEHSLSSVLTNQTQHFMTYGIAVGICLSAPVIIVIYVLAELSLEGNKVFEARFFIL